MVVGVTMVRDEADILEQTLRHMLSEVDHVIVADNLSADESGEIARDLGCEVIHDPEVGYYQSEKMTRLAQMARSAGADWIVPFDADEIWQAKGGLKGMLESLSPDARVTEAMLLDHVVTGEDPDLPGVLGIPWRRTAAAPLRKVAFRAHETAIIQQGNHSVIFEDDPHPLTVTGVLEIRHFPYRSPEQFIRKARNGAAAYAATFLPEEAGAHWRGYGRVLEEQGEDACAEIFHKWFYREDPTEEVEIEGERQPGLVYDPCQLRL